MSETVLFKTEGFEVRKVEDKVNAEIIVEVSRNRSDILSPDVKITRTIKYVVKIFDKEYEIFKTSNVSKTIFVDENTYEKLNKIFEEIDKDVTSFEERLVEKIDKINEITKYLNEKGIPYRLIVKIPEEKKEETTES